jgi:hypothetical protein
MAASVSDVAKPDDWFADLLAGCGIESTVGNLEKTLRMGTPFVRGANAAS